MKNIITNLVKIIIMVLLIPSVVFLLFFYLENGNKRAWFFATIVGLGNLMLFIFSPNHLIVEGIKKTGFF